MEESIVAVKPWLGKLQSQVTEFSNTFCRHFTFFSLLFFTLSVEASNGLVAAALLSIFRESFFQTYDLTRILQHLHCKMSIVLKRPRRKVYCSTLQFNTCFRFLGRVWIFQVYDLTRIFTTCSTAGHALGIWICGCSLLYRGELWASKSAGAYSTKSPKICGCKR